MMTSNTSRASVVPEDPHRATIRVRNIRESVVYHLMFDGDIGRLTGALLKQHIQAICGIPVDQQILTYNNFHVANDTTGYDVGLHDGCVLVLDTVARSSRRGADDPLLVRGSSREGSIAATTPGAAPLAANQSAAQSVPRPSVLPPSKSRFERELEALRREEGGGAATAAATSSSFRAAGAGAAASGIGLGAASGINQSSSSIYAPLPTNNGGGGGGGGSAALLGYPASGLYDDVDVDVEITEESGVPLWQPTNSIDVEESRLLQQDYIWKMEQVRFETERMNREREMLRQKQELDYQAELLERERIELERKTHTERLKLSMLQATLHDEMAIEAKVSAMTEESVYRSRF